MALSRPDVERAAWFDDACHGDAALRREVDELRAVDDDRWSPATVFNHESTMALDSDGALVAPHPRSNPSVVLTGTDGGKDLANNGPIPFVADTYGQAVTVTSNYLFVSALSETNANSFLGGGAIYRWMHRSRSSDSRLG